MDRRPAVWLRGASLGILWRAGAPITLAGVSVLSGWIPAWPAAKLDPAEALRGN